MIERMTRLLGVLAAPAVLCVTACGSDSEDQKQGATGLVGAPGVTLSQVTFNQAVERTVMENGNAVSSEVPLVAGRSAVVRVHYDTNSDYDGKPVTATFDLGDGAPLVVEQSLATSSDVAELTSTLNFHLPAARMLAGATNFAVRLEQPAGTRADNADARYPETGSADLHVEKSGVMKLVLVPYRYEADGSNRTPELDEATRQGLRNAIFQVFPVTDVEVTVHETVPVTQSLASTGAGWDIVLDSLKALRTANNAAANEFYLGLVQPAADADSFCTAGCVSSLVSSPSGTDPSPGNHAALGILYDEQQFPTLRWAIGAAHNRGATGCSGGGAVDLDYPHPDARTGVWGYDLITQALHGPTEKDFMSFCSGPWWVSDYTYRGLHEYWMQLVEEPQ